MFLPSLPDVIARPVSKGAELLRSSTASLAWGPLLGVSRSTVLGLLSRVETGTLLLTDEPTGRRHVFGQRPGPPQSTAAAEAEGGVNGDSHGSLPPNISDGKRRPTTVPRVELVVKRDAFWVRVLLFADMGFAEAYMLGEVECADLTAFFQLFIVNRDRLGNGVTWTSSLSNSLAHLARSTNTLSNALLNASAHYNASNDMFAAFLSPDMTYSCPIWELQPPDAEVEEPLERAQMTKLHRFIDGCRIKSTDHVLEIGTGWGSFAMEAVRATGCRVTTVTLSTAQKALAEQRIKAAGLSDRIQVLLLDYRAIPDPPRPYDKIVSIEMLEAVGAEFLETYFACVHRLLKKDGGIAMFQCITMPEGRHEAYSRSKDFINHYIFPGGYLPSITQLLNHISSASKGTLIVEKVENIGGHYTKALRLWREKFLYNFDLKITGALSREYPGMGPEEMEVWRRKWEYYFAYCEAGFLTKTLGDVIITVGREGALELMEGIPI